jgi:hypothetical protein
VVTSRYPAASASATGSAGPTTGSSPGASTTGSPGATVADRTSVPAVLIDSNGAAADPVAVTTAADLSEGFARLAGG